MDIANEAFEVLDADGNGGATRDGEFASRLDECVKGRADLSYPRVLAEIEMSLMEIHRERLSLASSMRDLDGAVSRLDNILMGIVFLICVLILTAMVVSTLIFSSSIPIF